MSSGNALARYRGQMVFACVAMALVLIGTLLAAIGMRAYSEVARQTGQYQMYKSLQKDAGKADSLSGIYAGVLEDLKKIRQALPVQNQASYVLNILVEEARNRNLSLAGITALDEVPFPNYKEIPFEVNLAGDFPNLVRYLYALETQGMVLQVRKLTIASEVMNQAKVKGRLELSVLVP